MGTLIAHGTTGGLLRTLCTSLCVAPETYYWPDDAPRRHRQPASDRHPRAR